MKANYRITALLCLCFGLLTGGVQAQKEGHGNSEKHGHGKGHDKHDKDKAHSKDHDQDHPGKPEHVQEKWKDKKEKAEDKLKDKKEEARHEKEDREEDKADKKEHQKDRDKDREKDDRDEAHKGDRDHEAGKRKITICHKPGSKEGGFPITISERAWKAHQAHGDTRGACPKPVSIKDPVFKKKTEFYERVAKTEEKVYDKEDLLTLARERLRKAKESLEKGTRTKTLPPAEIKAREARIARTGTLIAELEKMVTETRQQIRSEVDRVEAGQ